MTIEYTCPCSANGFWENVNLSAFISSPDVAQQTQVDGLTERWKVMNMRPKESYTGGLKSLLSEKLRVACYMVLIMLVKAISFCFSLLSDLSVCNI